MNPASSSNSISLGGGGSTRVVVSAAPSTMAKTMPGGGTISRARKAASGLAIRRALTAGSVQAAVTIRSKPESRIAARGTPPGTLLSCSAIETPGGGGGGSTRQQVSGVSATTWMATPSGGTMPRPASAARGSRSCRFLKRPLAQALAMTGL
ncbi:MAG: hypothetical protein WCJ64_08515 [Rhodospirillaceae bacterium]